MHVLVGRFDVHVPHSQSLKDKRSVVRRLRGRIRENFSISAAEVGLQDLRQRGVLGIAAVSPDRTPLEGLWNQLVEFVEANLEGELLDQECEIVDYGKDGTR